MDEDNIQECADMYFSADDCYIIEQLEEALRYQSENYQQFIEKINSEVQARQSL